MDHFFTCQYFFVPIYPDLSRHGGGTLARQANKNGKKGTCPEGAADFPAHQSPGNYEPSV